MASDERAVSGEPIPLRRRLVRVGGNPLNRSPGSVVIYLAERGFAFVPCHWPIRTGDSPVCSCSQSPWPEDHSTEAGRNRIGKHPDIDLCPHWKSDATSDPDQIRKWLHEKPNLNFGLVTGLPDTVVVDGRERELFLVVIDQDSTQAANQLQADIDMPKSLDILTGRGLHRIKSCRINRVCSTACGSETGR